MITGEKTHHVILTTVVAALFVCTPAVAANTHFRQQRDPLCSYEAPMGATVDTEGNVTKDGKTITHYDFSNCKLSNSGAGTGGWYEQVGANAISEPGGLKQFNAYEGNFTVPPAPADPSNDKSILYLFPGLENWNAGFTQVFSILQTMLIWGNNTDANTGEWWTMEGEFNWGPNIHGHGVRVSPGDKIGWAIWQTQINPDIWEIWMGDVTSGGSYAFFAQPASSWPKYNNIYLGVLEAYGDTYEQTGLNSCTELPPGDGEMFYGTSEISEAGPYWNSFNDVRTSLSWGGSPYPNGDGKPPSCSYQAWAASSDSAFLGWVP